MKGLSLGTCNTLRGHTAVCVGVDCPPPVMAMEQNLLSHPLIQLPIRWGNRANLLLSGITHGAKLPGDCQTALLAALDGCEATSEMLSVSDDP